MLPLAQMPRLALGLLAVAAMALTGCLLTPGKFTSQLDIRRDGRFSFSYSGEIYLIALSKLATMGDSDAFKGDECYRPGTMVKRPCTAAETAEQRQRWDETQGEAGDKRKRETESLKALLGGIDPADPKAAEELAARLRRQEGWRRVDYKGDGLFDVEFAISGTLDRDFTFPSIERFPMANAFVTINRHQDGTLRLDAPGFAANGNAPLKMMMGLDKGGESAPALPVTEGSFVLTTDAVILANNTDEGPHAGNIGQRLDWTITPRTASAPTALLRLRP
ncbi:MAG: hypothetical protein JWQ16_2677 [Novosphingobium sp.]|nr:hypothetical protein [Novosphingobium sp.]